MQGQYHIATSHDGHDSTVPVMTHRVTCFPEPMAYPYRQPFWQHDGHHEGRHFAPFGLPSSHTPAQVIDPSAHPATNPVLGAGTVLHLTEAYLADGNDVNARDGTEVTQMLARL